MNRRVLTGCLQAGAGVVGLVIGIAVGGPHLAKAAGSWASLFGLAVGLGGLALVIIGIRTTLRATSRRTRWLLPPAVVVALPLGLISLGQALLATWVPPTYSTRTMLPAPVR